MYHEHDPEIIECSNCGTEFDLARQHYYDDLCPSCASENKEWRTWIGCVACGTRLPRDQVEHATSTGRTGTEHVPVCSKGCKVHVETARHAPRGPAVDRGEVPYYDGHVAAVNDAAPWEN